MARYCSLCTLLVQHFRSCVYISQSQQQQKNKIKSFIVLAVIRRSGNELVGPISASLRPGNTAPFEEMSQRWRSVGNTVSDLTGPRFEPQTSRSRDERVTARPTGTNFVLQLVPKVWRSIRANCGDVWYCVENHHSKCHSFVIATLILMIEYAKFC